MSEFVDVAQLNVQAGNGGAGVVAFRRESHVPKGGPDGGDGGNGGDIWLHATRNVPSLLAFRDHPHRKAKSGTHGSGKKGTARRRRSRHRRSRRHGRASPGRRAARRPRARRRPVDGGEGRRGGRGNARFLSNARRAPSFAEQGEYGEERWLQLELKLLADAALVGFPNAGKSTLISVVSAAKPKIADYPFTTLVPNLGVVRFHEHEFVLADIPGLIEGAAEGKGLGHQFLRHVERARVLVILLDLAPVDGRSPDEQESVLLDELRRYQPQLLDRPRVVVGTKADVATRVVRGAHDLRGDARRHRRAARRDREARRGRARERRRVRRRTSCCDPKSRASTSCAKASGRGGLPVDRPSARSRSPTSRTTRRWRTYNSGCGAWASSARSRVRASTTVTSCASVRSSSRMKMECERAMLAVVKVGTSSITDERGDLDDAAILKLCGDLAAAHGAGHRVVLVLSGAIAAGMPALGLTTRPTDIGTLQALAAVGQPRLFERLNAIFSAYDIVGGQVLLTPYDFVHRSQYLHARETLQRLLDLGVLPIVNENDTIADDEIRYGDNDLLAALVSHLLARGRARHAHGHRGVVHRRPEAGRRRVAHRGDRRSRCRDRSASRAAPAPRAAAAAWRASSRLRRSPRGRACAS